jgi:hypothetical protein
MTHDEVREALFEALPTATPRRVETALRWATDELFSKVPELLDEQTITLVPNTTTYAVSLAAPDLRPASVRAAMMGTRRLRVFSAAEGRAQGVSGYRGLWFERSSGTIRLAWRPQQADTILAVFHMVPVSFAAVPPEMVDYHGEALVDGAKSQLFADVGRPYTNLTMAVAHSNKFIAAIRQRRRESLSGHVAADLWTPPLMATRSGPRRA